MGAALQGTWQLWGWITVLLITAAEQEAAAAAHHADFCLSHGHQEEVALGHGAHRSSYQGTVEVALGHGALGPLGPPRTLGP